MAQTRSKRHSTKGAGRKSGTRRSTRPLEDNRIKNEIVGVAVSALAITLFISIIAENSGVLPHAVATLLRGGFGVGAYFIPAFVLAWGITFFLTKIEIDETSIGAGLAAAFVCIVSMISLSAPLNDSFLDSEVVQSYGGYIGGGVAWVLRSLAGTAIAYVVLIAGLLIALIYSTGFSLTVAATALKRLIDRDTEELDVVRPSRAAKTLPIEDLAIETPAAEPADRKLKLKTAKRSASDPEALRKTLPTAKVVAPRALEGFELPPMDMLVRSVKPAQTERASEREFKSTAQLIEQTLATFDIQSRVTGWTAGPTVTMFEVKIAKGIKVGKVTALAGDLSLALAATHIRILAPIPGKSVIGIEVPNLRRSIVTLGDVLAEASDPGPSPLALAIGKDVAGESIVADLAAMPHLLIAGSTGTGKSVGINAMIMSILFRATPAEVRLILIDPKRIELNLYNGLPHLYVPVVTEPKEAASALYWAVGEMESRLKRLQKAGARNIAQYNALIQEGKSNDDNAEEMAYIIIVIDELADLMMIAAKEVEGSICRLAQLARAAGIHLVVATQRPSTDIITGLIKTNITHRIAFAVSSGIDSRVILDQTGAEKLVGLGDMLFSTPAWPKPHRLQGAFVTEREINDVIDYLRGQAEPEYHEEILNLKIGPNATSVGDNYADDPLLWEAADIVVTSGLGSTSMLQRRLRVGYSRAGRIMDMLEGKGIVGPPQGSKPRDVLSDVEELEAIKTFESMDASE